MSNGLPSSGRADAPDDLVENLAFDGVELGGTKCVCTLASGPGRILDQQIVPTTSPDETLPAILEILHDWNRHPGFRALGIASFGPIELDARLPAYGHILATTKAGWAGTEHLDAFADVVAGYAERTDPATGPADGWAATSVTGLLAFLDVAETVENGLAPAPLTVARDRVQVLTVHSAKGLEWQVVAVAHLSGGTFPSTASKSTWLTDAAELPPLLRGDRAAADALGIPVMDTSDVTNRKQLSDNISEHRRQLEQRRIDEERRLLYVAITRAEDTLLVSGHHWAATGVKPRGPSDFLCEIKAVIDDSAAAGDP